MFDLVPILLLFRFGHAKQLLFHFLDQRQVTVPDKQDLGGQFRSLDRARYGSRGGITHGGRNDRAAQGRAEHADCRPRVVALSHQLGFHGMMAEDVEDEVPISPVEDQREPGKLLETDRAFFLSVWGKEQHGIPGDGYLVQVAGAAGGADDRRVDKAARHQIQQLSALAEAGDLEDLKSYLAKTVSRIPNLDMCFCENRAADSVVGYYCAMARRDEIPFRARLDLPETLPIDEIDMCLVLSNLLENALEASLRTAPGRRQIEITAYVHADRILLIEVENAFDGEVNEKNGVFRSSKRRENGIGIQSVTHIAEKNGGTSTFTYQNGTFSAKVMLCGC